MLKLLRPKPEAVIEFPGEPGAYGPPKTLKFKTRFKRKVVYLLTGFQILFEFFGLISFSLVTQEDAEIILGHDGAFMRVALFLGFVVDLGLLAYGIKYEFHWIMLTYLFWQVCRCAIFIGSSR